MIYGAEFVHQWAEELDEILSGQRLFRVEGAENWLAMRFSSIPLSLFISWHPQSSGCCLLSENELDQVKRFSDGKHRFVDALKSHVVKGEVTAVKQVDYDRIIALNFSRKVGAGFDVERTLILEFMDRNSNIILLDENKVIIDCVKHIHPEINRYRTIVPSHPYVTPPPLQGPSPLELSPEASLEDMMQVKGIGRGLRSYMKDYWHHLSPFEWAVNIRKIYEETKPSKGLIQKHNSYITIFPLSLEDMASVGENKALIASKMFVVDPFIRDRSERIKKETMKIVKREIKSLERHLKGVEKQKNESLKATWYRTCGELLLANLYSISSRADNVSLSGWNDEGEITVEIPLDPNRSASDNASLYFKKYKKAKGDLEEIEQNITALEGRISELEDQLEIIEELEIPSLIDTLCRDIREWLAPAKKKKGKKANKEATRPPHLRLFYEDAILLVGLNARGNRYVTFQEASQEDIWLHVHELPGSHVVIKRPEGTKEDLEGTDLLTLAASLAAFFSKGRHSTRVQVDYTERKHVRHISGSGIAHVTYTHPETIIIDPDLWKEYFSEKEIIPEGDRL